MDIFNFLRGFFIVNVFGYVHCSFETLKLVQILYRHGDRTPIHEFPTDKHRDFWTIGFGQLTNVGKLQEYKLGQFIRQRYGGFLNDAYNRSEVVVRSTDVDRTLMSAQCNLAGLYPPKKEQIWEPALSWQPIPIHTLPEPEDYLLNVEEGNCPMYREASDVVLASAQMQQVNREYKDLYELLTKETGKTVNDVGTAGDIYDTLFIQKNNNLTMPSWLNDEIFNRLKVVSGLSFVYDVYSHEQRRLRGGPLVKELIANAKEKFASNNSAQRLFVYSAHDSNIAALLSALDVFNGISPPYACSIFVEAHALPNGTNAIQFLYRNTTEADPYILTIPNCSSLCPIDEFVRLTTSIIPDDIVQECQASKNVFGHLSMTVAVLTGILTFLLVVVLIVGIVNWRKKQRTSLYRYSIVDGE